MVRKSIPLSALLAIFSLQADASGLKVGVNERRIDAPRLPVILSGGFLARSVSEASGPLFARAIVADDGSSPVAIVLVDTLMVSREFLDEVKAAASARTSIPPGRMLIAATHTHSAPPLMGALGTDPNPGYIAFVRAELIELIAGARQRMQPARVGWASAQIPGFTNNRRWILRPDKVRKDPFGDPTVRANMHPGYQNPDFIGPSGPIDPELFILAFTAPDRRPIAVLANFSMHYVGGDKGVSPDYFGAFCSHLRRLLGVAGDDGGFVAMMSQGTSGDLHWMDYSRPKKDVTSDNYALRIASKALEIYRKIRFRDNVSLNMLETEVALSRRAPSPERLQWARAVMAQIPEGVPRNQVEVYAREQIYLDSEPRRALKLQAIRIGDLGIAAWPAEVYAVSGLKIKAQSPFANTFNIELANGAEGYIPPPEQHSLGGYTTWPARTAGLETSAEPRIVATLLEMLKSLSGKPLKPAVPPPGEYSRRVLRTRPAAYWRGEDMGGAKAIDASGNGADGSYSGNVALFLEGREARSPHFAGGHLRATFSPSQQYSIALWFRNGLPFDVRSLTGVVYSFGADQLAIGGLSGAPGKLCFQSGDRKLEGRTTLLRNEWNFVLVRREKEAVRIWLNGDPAAEIDGMAPASLGTELRLGAGLEPDSSLEGRIDEAAFYYRLLSRSETRNWLQKPAAVAVR